MSLKTYCKSCGSPTEYTLTKPRFCAGCGESFEVTASAPAVVNKPVEKIVYVEREPVREIPRKQSKLTKRQEAQYEPVDDDEVMEIPDMNALDIKIEGGRQRETLGGLVGTMSPELIKEMGTRPVDKRSKKTILNEWKNEAGKNPAKSVEVG